MDGFTNNKIEKQTIYEIYRACRLCGAGAGYKMPIIQNVVNLDSGEVELKHKVRECVQIEVHQDDKMPPLICELCVDKVNDFYEFLEMCRQTNKQTRLRLGLPPQTLPRGAPDAGDCILGVTEPVFIDDDDDEPANRSRGKTVKLKKESDNRDSKNKAPPKKEVKKEERLESRGSRRKAPSPSPSPPSTPRLLRGSRAHEDNMSLSRMRDGTPESRSLRKRAPSHSPSPARSLRGGKRQHEDDLALSRIQNTRKSDETTPKSILKKDRESKSEESTNLKRLREKENEKLVNSCKKVKIVVEDISSPPKESRAKHQCMRCDAAFDKYHSLTNHMRVHAKDIKPSKDLKVKEPKDRPKIECKLCNKTFIHKNLLDIHRCSGKPVANKPIKQDPQGPQVEKTKFIKQELLVEKPEKKSKSNKQEPLVEKQEKKTTSKPTRVATPKRKPTSSKPFVIDPEHKKLLKPLQVRIAKCDPLLQNKIGDHYDVTDVDYDYGTDKACVYPYIYTFRHLRIKSEPSYMVKIQEDIKNAFYRRQSYVHWDSDETDNSDTELSDSKKVNSLTSLSLKTLFSPKMIGKVPKKRRKETADRAFDSILDSTNDFDTDMRLGIDNIINSLGDDKDASKIDKDDNDSLFGDAPTSPAITNSDFDTLFGFNSDVPKSVDASKGVGDIISDNKSEDSNVTNLSMDFDDKVAHDDKNKGNDTTEDNNTSLENKDSSKEDERAEISAMERDKNDTDKNSAEDKKVGINDVTVNETQDGDENSKEDVVKDLSHDDNTSAKEDENVKENHTESKGAENDENHVNGQAVLAEEFNVDDLEDISDTEMEETKLMEALDDQIDGSSGGCKVTDDLQIPASVKSTDLESISEGELP